MTDLGGHLEWHMAAETRVTLERLLSVVGPGALELDTAPGGLTVPVGGIAVLDPLEPGVRPRVLVLAVGVDAGSAQARDLVHRAGAAGATGVVFGPDRSAQSAGALRSAAEEAGTAVLFRTRWCPWEQLVGVIRAGLAAAGEPCGRGARPGGPRRAGRRGRHPGRRLGDHRGHRIPRPGALFDRGKRGRDASDDHPGAARAAVESGRDAGGGAVPRPVDDR